MNVKARFALVEIIAEWAIKFELSPEEEINLLEKQLNTSKEAALVVSMDKYSPDEV